MPKIVESKEPKRNKKGDGRTTFRLDLETTRLFRLICNAMGENPTATVEHLMRDYIKKQSKVAAQKVANFG